MLRRLVTKKLTGGCTVGRVQCLVRAFHALDTAPTIGTQQETNSPEYQVHHLLFYNHLESSKKWEFYRVKTAGVVNVIDGIDD